MCLTHCQLARLKHALNIMFQFEEIFRPYSRYCSEQTNCQEYCREQDRTNEIFKAYLAVST